METQNQKRLKEKMKFLPGYIRFWNQRNYIVTFSAAKDIIEGAPSIIVETRDHDYRITFKNFEEFFCETDGAENNEWYEINGDMDDEETQNKRYFWYQENYKTAMDYREGKIHPETIKRKINPTSVPEPASLEFELKQSTTNCEGWPF